MNGSAAQLQYHGEEAVNYMALFYLTGLNSDTHIYMYIMILEVWKFYTSMQTIKNATETIFVKRQQSKLCKTGNDIEVLKA